MMLSTPDLINNNETFHKYLIEGITIEYQKDGMTRGDTVKLIDFDHPENNEFLAVNQFTIIENNHNRRPDIILFINGLPLVVIELKNPSDEKATLIKAFQQFDTYKQEIPTLFTYNAFLIISDGLEAKVGSISADYSRFMKWKKPPEQRPENTKEPELETLITGLLNKPILLDFIRHFIVFEKSKQENPKTKITSITTIKKIAAYHQYYAVNKAIERVKSALSQKDNFQDSKGRKGGVIWHTQGSGKSLSMVFFSGKLIIDPHLYNPTLVILTDRNDLDDQLFDTFAASRQLLRQDPEQAENRPEFDVKKEENYSNIS